MHNRFDGYWNCPGSVNSGESAENENWFLEDDNPPRSEPAPGMQEWLKQVIASDPGPDAAWKTVDDDGIGYSRVGTTSKAEGLPDGWHWIDYDDYTGNLISPNGLHTAPYNLHDNSFCVDEINYSDPAYTPDEAGLKRLKKDALPIVKEYINKKEKEYQKERNKRKQRNWGR